MSAIATPVARIVGRNVTVTVPAGVPCTTAEDRAPMRKLACQEAHTATIGKLISVSEGPAGTVLTWGPVVARSGAPRTAPSAPAPAPVVETQPVVPDGAMVASMSKRDLRELVAKLLAERDAAPAPAKAPSAFIAAQVAKREAVTCKTCRDLGVVRGMGGNAGKPYRTQAGADAATAAGRSVKCPTHKRAKRAA